MTTIHKNKPKRDKKYLKNICDYGCVITGQDAIPHHLKGYKQGGGKCSDYLTFPLSDKYHSAAYTTGLHNDTAKWEELHGLQTYHIKETLHMALRDRLITQKDYEIAYRECIDLDKRFRS